MTIDYCFLFLQDALDALDKSGRDGLIDQCIFSGRFGILFQD